MASVRRGCRRRKHQLCGDYDYRGLATMDGCSHIGVAGGPAVSGTGRLTPTGTPTGSTTCLSSHLGNGLYEGMHFDKDVDR